MPNTQARRLGESQAAVAIAAETYDNPEKQRIRGVLTRAVQELGGPVLDLWGGGESARQLVRTFPGVRVVSADNNRSFRLALEQDAKENGYEPYAGNIQRVEGRFQVINLDTCNGIGKAAQLARKVAPKLSAGGLLAVTVMGTNRRDEYSVRSAGFAAELSALCGLMPIGVFRYRTLRTGIPAFVVWLTQYPSQWSRPSRPSSIHKQVEGDGFFLHLDWAWLLPRFKDHERQLALARISGRALRASRREPLPPCLFCGGPLPVRSDVRRRYCSNRCKHKAQYERDVPRVERACKGCGTTFPVSSDGRRLYCSAECKSRNRPPRKGKLSA